MGGWVGGWLARAAGWAVGGLLGALWACSGHAHGVSFWARGLGGMHMLPAGQHVLPAAVPWGFSKASGSPLGAPGGLWGRLWGGRGWVGGCGRLAGGWCAGRAGGRVGGLGLAGGKFCKDVPLVLRHMFCIVEVNKLFAQT